MRPACPVCVTRYCQNCFKKDVAINRLWLDQHHPDGECRHCGAVKETVIETPVRHTNRTKHQDHVDSYAAHLLTKPPKLVPQDPRRMDAIEVLLAEITDDVFSAYSARKRIWADVDGIPEQNERNSIKLRIEKSIRQWVADHPEADRG